MLTGANLLHKRHVEYPGGDEIPRITSSCETSIMAPIPQENPDTTACGTRVMCRPSRMTQNPIMMTEAYTMADSTYQWAMQNKVGFSYWSWVDWGGGILSNAKTSTPNSSGTTLKNSYCTQPSVNSLSAC